LVQPEDTKLYEYLDTALASARVTGNEVVKSVLKALKEREPFFMTEGYSLQEIDWFIISWALFPYYAGIDKTITKTSLRKEWKSLKPYFKEAYATQKKTDKLNKSVIDGMNKSLQELTSL